jgi:hypothetical protein
MAFGNSPFSCDGYHEFAANSPLNALTRRLTWSSIDCFPYISALSDDSIAGVSIEKFDQSNITYFGVKICGAVKVIHAANLTCNNLRIKCVILHMKRQAQSPNRLPANTHIFRQIQLDLMQLPLPLEFGKYRLLDSSSIPRPVSLPILCVLQDWQERIFSMTIIIRRAQIHELSEAAPPICFSFFVSSYRSFG